MINHAVVFGVFGQSVHVNRHCHKCILISFKPVANVCYSFPLPYYYLKQNICGKEAWIYFT